jgi:glycogen operon protein
MSEPEKSPMPSSKLQRVNTPAINPGEPHPLGATWDGEGTNFALYSSVAEKVELCLFDAEGQRESARIEVPHRTGHIWHVHVAGCAPGTLYGYRVHGAYEPAAGVRCNGAKLLLDPYARGIVGEFKWSNALYAYPHDAPEQDLARNDEDSAAFMPRCQVVDDTFDWGDDRPPRVAWRDTVFYEVHVKGFTHRHSDVPPRLRGTYAGLASEEAIAHFKRLGVTAIELLPVHAFADDHRLVDLGLRNHWGYNSIGFFAPAQRYNASGTLAEFKGMVKLLHAAGLEVILDVVYNHTAEGNQLGPTLSFKGIDNAIYYRLAEDPRYYHDVTGTGNTIDSHQPVALRLIMDSLRYWVQEVHVDGFRFDLASALGRSETQFNWCANFFAAIAQDPVLATVKLIAEPWDTGEGGYQVGGFPLGWAEWNGRYRDAVRAFWRGDEGMLGEFTQRLSGSRDLYDHDGRAPTDSVNIVTVHDGFTLCDLVSYNDKHNEANLEDNRDGENNNNSWNCGIEGPTDDPDINALRERQQRNFLATLFVSQGTPLLLGGDELGRTQQGNNNGYCQDNEISWVDWKRPQADWLRPFVERLTALRRELPALRRPRFLTGEPDADGVKDVTWLNLDALEMGDEEWAGPARSVAMMLCGRQTGEVDAAGHALESASVLLLFNAFHEPLPFKLPALRGHDWSARLDTQQDDGQPRQPEARAGDTVSVGGRSMMVFTQAPAATDDG